MKIGYLPGVWDLFHVGHLRMIERAAEQCDHLVVGVCSDECVERSKGRRPFVPCEQRQEIVSEVVGVYEALAYESVYQGDMLRLVHPAVFFHGPEYGQLPAQSETLAACAARGTRTVMLPRTSGVSTTELIRKIIEAQRGDA